MAPKLKITKEQIMDAALELIRESGDLCLTPRRLAEALGCSTQPLYSNFSSFEELEQAVLVSAHERYLGFIKNEVESGNYPEYKAYGMAYIRFAKEEPILFRLIFMRDNQGKASAPTADYIASVEMIMKANGISRERAELMHLEMWACVHGIATMLATSFFAPDWALISRMVSDIYQGVRSLQVLEGKG